MSIDQLQQRRLESADIAALVMLSAEPEWNQVAADWRLMLARGDSFGYATADGRLVASGLTVLFDAPFAWISMILVTAAHRRRGLATRLMRWCMEALEWRSLVPALDASPEGRMVYRQLGFRDVYTTTRMYIETPVSGLADAQEQWIRPLLAEDLPRVYAFDRPLFGGGREYMLEHLRSRLPEAAFLAERSGRVIGYVLGRDGRICAQLGPLVAEDIETTLALLAQACRHVRQPLCIDIADHHSPLRKWLDARGFVPIVPFVRMVLNREEPFDDPRRVFAIAGPELG